MKEEIYFSADIETNGPIPGEYSMLSFGVVALTKDGKEIGNFQANLELLENAKEDPDTMEWWKGQPDAWSTCRKDLQNPKIAINNFVNWVKNVCKDEYIPVMVCYPAGFDFTFMYWYMIKFANYSPFSFSAVDIKSYVMGMRSKPYKSSSKTFWPKRWFPEHKHTHVALEDAREQGFTFINILKENNNNDN